MRKLLSIASFSFALWFVITFAWAAASHITGLPGPARASAASLEMAAGAITLVDPPGIMGAPQRFAAHQLERAAHAASRLHRGPERAVARTLDRMGHAQVHHRGHRHRHAHDRRVRVRIQKDQAAPYVRVERWNSRRDDLQRIRAAQERALERGERARERAERAATRAQERARRTLERARARAERDRERAVRVRGVEASRLVRELEALVEQEIELDRPDRERIKRELERKIEELLRRLGEVQSVELDLSALDAGMEQMSMELSAIAQELEEGSWAIGSGADRIRIHVDH